MFLVKCMNFLSSFLMAVTIEPSMTNPGLGLGFLTSGLGQALGKVLNWLLGGIVYGICKWLLAFMDFLQYFIQKLIGLDYWLNTSHYTISGALKSDLLFSFLYNDTVQKTFRAIVGVSIVLLIIFTIFAIVRSEWQYITGGGKGGNFGDGQNSKGTIIRNALKAITLVVIFPMVLMMGIISSNAILASLVKALTIDTGSTFGQAIFNISAQNANKYRTYGAGERYGITDEVTFYIYNDKYLSLGTTRLTTDQYEYRVDSYEEYIELASKSQKYTVNTMFEVVNPMLEKSFSGYCVRLEIDGTSYYYLVADGDNNPTALYHYLTKVLRVDLLTRSNNAGNADLLKEIGTSKFSGSAHITGLNLKSIDQDSELAKASYNTWGYSTVYLQGQDFDSSSFYVKMNGGTKFNEKLTGGSSLLKEADSKSLLQILGFDENMSAKVMFNSQNISPYFDGGQFGFVQLRSEYYVMSEVVEFIADSGMKLHIVNANSPNINWYYSSDYTVADSGWVPATNIDSNNGKGTGVNTGNGTINSTSDYANFFQDSSTSSILGGKIPFIVSYSDVASETDAGNTLYLADSTAKNEKDGAIYIMCFEASYEEDGNKITKYVPLLNNRTYTDPITHKAYRFSSDYYSSNYKGVVIAKGIMDNSHNDYVTGFPTYIEESSTSSSGVDLTNGNYYYEMVVSGSIKSYVTDYTGSDYNVDFATSAPVLDSDILENSYSNPSYSSSRSNSQFAYRVTYEVGGNETTEALQITEELIESMTIPLTYNGVSYSATYAGSANGNRAFFSFTAKEMTYYTQVSWADDKITILSYNSSGTFSNNSKEAVKCATVVYNLMYDFTDDADSRNSEEGVVVGTIGASDLSKSKYNSSSGVTYFTTSDKVYISKTKKYDFLTIGLKNASGTGEVDSLVTLGSDGTIKFAQSAGSSGGNNSTYFTFYLYDYYAGYVNGSVKTMESGTIGDATRDDDKAIKCFVDSSFSWSADSPSYGLYNGKEYIATIYKNQGTACDDIGNLPDVTSQLLYNYKTYYNIKTQNSFKNETEFTNYFSKIQGSLITAFKRTNVTTGVFRLDFHFKFLAFRVNFDLGRLTIERNKQFSTAFKADSGIEFDYFFDSEVGLGTFYSQTKIGYWIIVVASVLIIKTLGTALWGIVKRFYEITLYFLAMPAVASTIPLDDGQRFTSSIQQPLIKKVLGTYGIILGINVFFVLLTPVKALSQVFTAEDIATSGSYFLQHIGFLWMTPSAATVAKILNNFVYILFMLVAFTMIDTLPNVVSQMVGGENLKQTGAETKKASRSQMQSVGNTMAGNNLVNGISNAGSAVKNSGIVRAGKAALTTPFKAGKAISDKIKKGHDEAIAEDVAASGEMTPDKVSNRNGEDEQEVGNEPPVTTQNGNETETGTTPTGGDAPPQSASTTVGITPTQASSNPELQKIQDAANQVDSQGESSEEAYNEQMTTQMLENKKTDMDGTVAQTTQSLSDAVVEGTATEEQKNAVSNAVSNVVSEKAGGASDISITAGQNLNAQGNAGDPSQNALTMEKFEALKSTLSPEELSALESQLKDTNGNPLDEQALIQKILQILQGYKFDVKKDENGNQEVTVSELENGQVKEGTERKVDDQIATNLVADAGGVKTDEMLAQVNQTGNASAVSNQDKIDAIRSTLTGEEKANFDKQFTSDGMALSGKALEEKQAQVLQNYEFGADGNGNLTVGEKNGPQKAVAGDIANKIKTNANKSVMDNSGIDKVFNGTNGFMNAVSTQTKVDAVRSTMSKQEQEQMDQAIGDKQGDELRKAQEAYLAQNGYSVTGVKNADGNIDYAVQKKDNNGNVVSMNKVGGDVKNKIDNEILKSGKISDAELTSAVQSNALTNNAISKATSSNLILATNSTTGGLNEDIINKIGERTDEQSTLVKGNAMIDALRATDSGRKILNGIMKNSGMKGVDYENDPEKKAQLAKLLVNTDNNEALNKYMEGHTKEYRDAVLVNAKDAAVKGNLSITAYDLASKEERDVFEKEREEKREQRETNNILTGATDDEKEKIMSNVVRNAMSIKGAGSMGYAKVLETEVFANNVKKEEIEALSIDQLRILTGKKNLKSYDELTQEDRAKLGFVKKQLGKESLSDIDLTDDKVKADVQNNLNLYHNDDSRMAAFEKFSNTEIYSALQNNPQLNQTFVNLATNDASYAITPEEKKTIDSLNKTKIEQEILQQNPGITTYELNQKVAERLQKEYQVAANANFDTDNEISKDKQEASVVKSVEDLRKDKDALLQAFTTSNVVDDKQKTTIIENGVKKMMGLETPEQSDNFVEKLVREGKLTQDQIKSLRSEGLSNEQIALTYQKAMLAGKFDEKETDINKIYAGIDELKDDSSAYDKDIIDGMQKRALSADATPAEIKAYTEARDLMLSSVSKTDMEKVIDVASSTGINALTNEQKEEFTRYTAVIDRATIKAIMRELLLSGEVNVSDDTKAQTMKNNEEFAKIYKEKTGQDISLAGNDDILKFYENNKNSLSSTLKTTIEDTAKTRQILADKTGLSQEQMNKMSSSELNTRLDDIASKEISQDQVEALIEKDEDDVIGRTLRKNTGLQNKIDGKVGKASYHTIAQALQFDTGVSNELLVEEVRNNDALLDKVRMSKVTVSDEEVLNEAKKDDEFIKEYEQKTGKKASESSDKDLAEFLNASENDGIRDRLTQGRLKAKANTIKYEDITDDDINNFLYKNVETKNLLETKVKASGVKAVSTGENSASDSEVAKVYDDTNTGVTEYTKVTAKQNQAFVDFVKKQTGNKKDFDINSLSEEDYNNYLNQFVSDKKNAKSVQEINNNAKLLMITARKQNIDTNTAEGKAQLEELSKQNLKEKVKNDAVSEQFELADTESKKIEIETIKANSDFADFVNKNGSRVSDLSNAQILQEYEKFKNDAKNQNAVNEIEEKRKKVTYLVATSGIQSNSSKMNKYIEEVSGLNETKLDKSIEDRELVRHMTKVEKESMTTQAVTERNARKELEKELLDEDSSVTKEVKVYAELNQDKYEEFLKARGVDIKNATNEDLAAFYVAEASKNDENYQKTAEQAREIVDLQANTESYLAMNKNSKKYKTFLAQSKMKDSKLAQLRFYQAQTMEKGSVEERVKNLKFGQQDVDEYIDKNSSEFNDYVAELDPKAYEEFKEEKEFEAYAKKNNVDTKNKSAMKKARKEFKAEKKKGTTFIDEASVKRDYAKEYLENANAEGYEKFKEDKEFEEYLKKNNVDVNNERAMFRATSMFSVRKREKEERFEQYVEDNGLKVKTKEQREKAREEFEYEEYKKEHNIQTKNDAEERKVRNVYENERKSKEKALRNEYLKTEGKGSDGIKAEFYKQEKTKQYTDELEKMSMLDKANKVAQVKNGDVEGEKIDAYTKVRAKEFEEFKEKNKGKDLDLLKVEFYEADQQKLNNDGVSKTEKEIIKKSMSSAETMTNIKKGTKLGEEINQFVSDGKMKSSYAKFKSKYGDDVDENLIKAEFYNANKSKFDKKSKNYKVESTETLESFVASEKQVRSAGKSAMSFFKDKGLVLKKSAVKENISEDGIDAQIIKDAESKGVVIDDETAKNKRLLESNDDAMFKAYSEYEDVDSDVADNAVKAYFGINTENADAMAEEVKSRLSQGEINKLVKNGITTNEQLVVAYKKVMLAGRGKSNTDLAKALNEMTNSSANEQVFDKVALQAMQDKGLNGTEEEKQAYMKARNVVNSTLDENGLKTEVLDAVVGADNFNIGDYSKFKMRDNTRTSNVNKKVGVSNYTTTYKDFVDVTDENQNVTAYGDEVKLNVYSNSEMFDKDVANNVVKAYAGLDKVDEVNNVVNELYSKNVNLNEIKELGKDVGIESNEDIALAYKKAMLSGKINANSSKEEITKAILDSTSNENTILAMQSIKKNSTEGNFDDAVKVLNGALTRKQKTSLVEEYEKDKSLALSKKEQDDKLVEKFEKGIDLAKDPARAKKELQREHLVEEAKNNLTDNDRVEAAKKNQYFMKSFKASGEKDINEFYKTFASKSYNADAVAEIEKTAINDSILASELSNGGNNAKGQMLEETLRNRMKNDGKFAQLFYQMNPNIANSVKDADDIQAGNLLNFYKRLDQYDSGLAHSVTREFDGKVKDFKKLDKNEQLDKIVQYREARGRKYNVTDDEINNRVNKYVATESNKSKETVKAVKQEIQREQLVADTRKDLSINEKVESAKKNAEFNKAFKESGETDINEFYKKFASNDANKNIVDEIEKNASVEKLSKAELSTEDAQNLNHKAVSMKSQMLEDTLRNRMATDGKFAQLFYEKNPGIKNSVRDDKDIELGDLVKFYKKLGEYDSGLSHSVTKELNGKVKDFKKKENDEKLDLILKQKASRGETYNVSNEEVAQRLKNSNDADVQNLVKTYSSEIVTETDKKLTDVTDTVTHKESDEFISKDRISKNEELQFMAYANSLKTTSKKDLSKTTGVVDEAVKIYANFSDEVQAKTRVNELEAHTNIDRKNLTVNGQTFSDTEIMLAYTKAKLSGQTVDKNGNELKGAELEKVITNNLDTANKSKEEINNLNATVMQNIQNNATRSNATEVDARAYNRVKEYINGTLTDSEKDRLVEDAAKNGVQAMSDAQKSELQFAVAQANSDVSDKIKREKLLDESTDGVSKDEFEERKLANLLLAKGNTKKEITEKDEQRAERLAKVQFALQDTYTAEMVKSNKDLAQEFAKQNSGKDINTATKEDIVNFYNSLSANPNNDADMQKILDQLTKDINKKLDGLVKEDETKVNDELNKVAQEQNITFDKADFNKYTQNDKATQNLINTEIGKMSYNEASNMIGNTEVKVVDSSKLQVKTREEIIAEYRSNPELMQKVRQSYAKENGIVIDEVGEKSTKVSADEIVDEISNGNSADIDAIKDEIIKQRAENQGLGTDQEVVESVKNGSVSSSQNILNSIQETKKADIELEAKQKMNVIDRGIITKNNFDRNLENLINNYNGAKTDKMKENYEAQIKDLLSRSGASLDRTNLDKFAGNIDLLKSAFGNDEEFAKKYDINLKDVFDAEKVNIEAEKQQAMKNITVEDSDIEQYLNGHTNEKERARAEVVKGKYNSAPVTKDEIENFVKNGNSSKVEKVKNNIRERKVGSSTNSTTQTPSTPTKKYKSMREIISEMEAEAKKAQMVETVYASEGNLISVQQMQESISNRDEKGAGERAKTLLGRILNGSGNVDDIDLSDASSRSMDKQSREKILKKAKGDKSVALTPEEIKKAEDDSLNDYVMQKFGNEINNEYNAEINRQLAAAEAGVYIQVKSKEEIKNDYIAKLGKDEKFKVTSKAKDDALITKYTQENESALYETKGETKADAMLEKTKQMAMGIDGTNGIVADLARSDKKNYQKIVSEFQKTHQGIEFSELDITEQNKYLASKYQNNVSDEIVQNKYLEMMVKKGVISTSNGSTKILDSNGEIDQNAFKELKHNILKEKGNMTVEQYLASGKGDKYLRDSSKRENIEKIANRNDGSLEQLAIKNMDSNVFANLHKKISADLTDSTNEVFVAEKKAIVESKVTERMNAGKVNPTTAIPDISKMSEKEAREFSATKIMLGNQIRENTNPQILKNILSNTNLVNEDQILRELAKEQKIDESLYKKDDGSIDKSKLLGLLDNNTINNYFNKNIEMRDTMLSIGANDLTTTLNEEQRKKTDLNAIKNNENLKNQILLDTLATDSSVNIKSEVLKYARSSAGLTKGEKNDIERDIRNELKNELIAQIKKQNPNRSEASIAKGITEKDLDKYIKDKNISDSEISEQVLGRNEINKITRDINTNKQYKNLSDTERKNIIAQTIQDKTNLKVASLVGIDTDGMNAGEVATKLSELKAQGKLTNGIISEKLKVANKQSEVAERKLAQKYNMYHSVSNDDIKNVGKDYKAIAEDFGVRTSKNALTKEELNQALVSQERRKEIENDVRANNMGKSETEISKLVSSQVEAEANEKIAQRYGINAGMNNVSKQDLNQEIFTQSMKHKQEIMLAIAKDKYTDSNGNIKASQSSKIAKKIDEEKNSKDNPTFRNNLYSQVKRDISYTKNMSEDQLTQFIENQEIQKKDDLSFGKFGSQLKSDIGSFFTGIGSGVGGAAHGVGHKFKGAIYGLVKKTPENSSSYNNWNATIQKQIAEIRRGEGAYKDLSQEQRQDEIQKLQQKLIFTNKSKPSDYAQMTAEEKRTWRENQTKLKAEAFKTKDFTYIKKRQTKLDGTGKVGRQSFVSNFGYKFGFQGKNVTNAVKEQHKKDLSSVKSLITEYNATNDKLNFTDDFEAIARKYLGDKKSTDKLINDNKDKSASARQKAIEDALAKKYKIASHRVAHDNGTKRKDFLEERGIGSTVVRYKDATKKYTALKSSINMHIPIPGVNKLINAGVNAGLYHTKKMIVDHYDKKMIKTDGNVGGLSKFLYNRVYGKRNGDSKAQTLARKNNLEIDMKRIQQLNLNFKGTGAEYSAEVEKILGPLATKVYDKKFIQLYDRNSAVAIQKNGVMKSLEKMLEKENKRLNLRTNIIPAGEDATSQYIGKEYKNSRSAMQKENDVKIAEDLNNSLNLVLNQKSISSYDAVLARMLPQVSEQFKFKYGDSLDGKTDKEKFAVLEKYLQKQLNKANNRVHNNGMVKNGVDKLKKLNGMTFKSNEIFNGKISGTMVNAVMNSDARYKEIMRKYESDNSRYLTEKQNRENLQIEYNKLYEGPRNSYTKKEIQRVSEAMAESNTRLKVLKSALKKSEDMKKTFELSYAEKQIETARMSNAMPPMRMDGIFDSYNVYQDVLGPNGRPMMGPNGRPMRRPLDPHSPAARELAMMSRRFMNDYRVQIYRMKFALRNQRYVDYEMKRELDRISRKVDGKFSDRIQSMRTLMDNMDKKIKNLKDSQNRDQLEYRNTLIEQRTRLERIKTQLVTSMNEKNYKLEEKVMTNDRLSRDREDNIVNRVNSNTNRLIQSQTSKLNLNPAVSKKKIKIARPENARIFDNPTVEKETDPVGTDNETIPVTTIDDND